jgi:hypothetical protein
MPCVGLVKNTVHLNQKTFVLQLNVALRLANTVLLLGARKPKYKDNVRYYLLGT